MSIDWSSFSSAESVIIIVESSSTRHISLECDRSLNFSKSSVPGGGCKMLFVNHSSLESTRDSNVYRNQFAFLNHKYTAPEVLSNRTKLTENYDKHPSICRPHLTKAPKIIQILHIGWATVRWKGSSIDIYSVHCSRQNTLCDNPNSKKRVINSSFSVKFDNVSASPAAFAQLLHYKVIASVQH